jgi:hypothetical protein
MLNLRAGSGSGKPAFEPGIRPEKEVIGVVIFGMAARVRCSRYRERSVSVIEIFHQLCVPQARIPRTQVPCLNDWQSEILAGSRAPREVKYIGGPWQPQRERFENGRC